MNKVTVLYKHPESEEAFEKYYAETHLPLAAKIPHLDHAEFTKFMAAPDGSKSAYYRMAELYFASDELMMQALGSDEGRAAAGDIPKFATGGFEFLFGKV
ncbi:MAG TPA: EthD family reductase [Chitinophagaceae bacterium]|nr:EthD family reductase [Chitinophagaceae bacterium]